MSDNLCYTKIRWNNRLRTMESALGFWRRGNNRKCAVMRVAVGKPSRDGEMKA